MNEVQLFYFGLTILIESSRSVYQIIKLNTYNCHISRSSCYSWIEISLNNFQWIVSLSSIRPSWAEMDYICVENFHLTFLTFAVPLRVIQVGQERGWRGGGGPREEAQGETGEANEPRERGAQRTDRQRGDRQQPQVATRTQISSDCIPTLTVSPNEGFLRVFFPLCFHVNLQTRGNALQNYLRFFFLLF